MFSKWIISCLFISLINLLLFSFLTCLFQDFLLVILMFFQKINFMEKLFLFSTLNIHNLY